MGKSKIANMISSLDNDIFLKDTSKAYELDDTLKYKESGCDDYLFQGLYGDSNRMVKKMATILNAVFTQKMQTFMLNRNSCIKLIKEDSNHELSLGNKEYSRLLWFITNTKMFQVLRQPTNKKSGVYKLIQPELVKELHRLAADEYFEAQEKLVLDFYENEGRGKVVSKKPVVAGGDFDPNNYKSKLSKAIAEDLKKHGIKYDPTKV